MPHVVNNITIYQQTDSGLILEATYQGGSTPVTASTFAPGAMITDLATGTKYYMTGTTAVPVWSADSAASGTVTSVSVTTANGVSGSIATSTTTPAITLTLGAITPSGVTVSGLTASEMVITDGSKVLTSAAVATYPSLTQLSYVKGVTSAIQTQIDAKGVGTWTDSSTSTGSNKTFTAPALGTPASGVMTNMTGLPAAAILPGTLVAGTYLLAENASLGLDPAGSADGKYSGITITGTAGATIAFGDLVYLAVADSKWKLTDADAAATGAGVMIGMSVVSTTDTNPITVLLLGQIRADAKFPALTIGASVYVGETAGAIQVAIPTGADNVIRVVGFALTADEIYFNPSQDSQITVA